ncbi:MAG: substrate-binding domain-containing protein [Nitrospirae bacterium]|nr:substrate-binding domain-containing protein [Nitrospirota bacterium]
MKFFKCVKMQVIIFAVIMLSLTLPGGYLYAEDYKGAIKIGGTGSGLGVMKEMADAFQRKYPDVNIIIVPSLGSGGGIKAVFEGAIDIGLSGRPLKADEEKGGITAFECARTPFVFVTARKTKGINFTLQDFAKIYAGEIKNWPDGEPIRVVLRPEGDMDTILLKGMSSEMDKALKKALAHEGALLATTDQDSAESIEKIPGALGTSSLSVIIPEKRRLNILPIGGVTPGVKTLADGAYPYYKNLFIVTGPKISLAAKGFIDFINTKEGRTILRKTGHHIIEKK